MLVGPDVVGENFALVLVIIKERAYSLVEVHAIYV
jgi:hypothetical protein